MNQKLLYTILAALFLSGCPEKKETPRPNEAEPVKVQLEAVRFADLNGFQQDNLAGAYQAFSRSCNAIAKRKGEFLNEAAEVKISLKDYQRICKKLYKIAPRDFKTFVKQNFIPMRVTYGGRSTGKFTSYYEAALHASYQKTERYKYPVYGKPTDLIEFNPHDFDPKMPSKRLVGRLENQKLVPYYTRGEIGLPGYKAPVILWADSEVDVFVMQIQGSAVAQLEDGSKIRIAYADNNGREFKGIGSILLSQGLIKPGEASMGSIKRWLKNNPTLGTEQMNHNQRFVFHRLSEAEGPIGAQGVPLTAGRSLAVDKAFIPLGIPLWLETTGPHREKIQKLVVAQDIGGAIKGAIRGDYFWGSGGDDILELAGRMNAEGQYYILMPKTAENSKNGY